MTPASIENINLLYSDPNIIAVDKPEGIASISENDTSIETIHSLLEKKFEQKIYVVHRIDKEVSGIILFAKNPETHKYLNRLFESRSIKKNYTALVHGSIKNDTGRIDKPIREFGSGRMGIDEKNGKRSITDYKLLKKYKNFSLLDISIITGRRHQIRVHLYSIDHPIAGDLRYGDKNIQSGFPRLMLHAGRIEFELKNARKILIESRLPDSFTDYINQLSV
ncbi:MAG TPA: RNA pseudouridine synthase [Melioribacteraceae bacterium]|nr:RNA pseudouridine synthase [Melioribacteraceae bacterium]